MHLFHRSVSLDGPLKGQRNFKQIWRKWLASNEFKCVNVVRDGIVGNSCLVAWRHAERLAVALGLYNLMQVLRYNLLRRPVEDTVVDGQCEQSFDLPLHSEEPSAERRYCRIDGEVDQAVHHRLVVRGKLHLVQLVPLIIVDPECRSVVHGSQQGVDGSEPLKHARYQQNVIVQLHWVQEQHVEARS
eukprot:1702891-Prymnesium_polylepis.1